jgi:phosphonate transport system ATP-binding protein
MPSSSSPENSISSSADEVAHFELSSLTRRFNGVAALDGVNLRVSRGERVALVGPSGSGKTTLLRLLNATERPTSGCVRVRGHDLAALPIRRVRRIRSRIGTIAQDLSLVPNLRVSQNVLAGRLGRRTLLASARAMFLPRREDLLEAHRILERVGIPEKLFERTDRLSGGQMQRVAIARALFQDPEAILADEPVSAVDPARAEDTVRLLTEISKERGLTLVMSIHNLELARRYFPRLVGLRSGRIRLDEAPGTIADDEFEDLYQLGAEEILANGA